MKLIIQIKDGKPYQHPIFEENFIQAFPDLDIENLPPEFARFERVDQPVLGVYEKNQRLKYVLGEDGICRDVWQCDPMTEEEILEKQEFVKNEWNSSEDSPKSWIFDESICNFVPPIPKPDNELEYHWNEELYQSDNSKGWVKI